MTIHIVLIRLLALTALAAAAPPATSLDYSKPGLMVDVGKGRRVHLFCAGRGSPTVLLIAGLGNSAVVWDRIQPDLSARSRVCAWDRAGFGFSDGSPNPQTTLERTRDLERALRGAKITGPYIIVGHSLGSYESLVFTDRHKRDVAGMVLVDPSIPDQLNRLFAHFQAAGAFTRTGRMAGIASVAKCADEIRAGTLRVGGPDPDGCFQYPAYYSEALTKRLTALDMDPLRSATRLSLYRNGLDSADPNTAPVVNPKRNYGSMPMVVLSSDPPPGAPPGAPAAAIAEQPAVVSEWRLAHEEMAHLSTVGVHRIVPRSGHAIQRSNPDAVTAAVKEVVRASRKRPR